MKIKDFQFARYFLTQEVNIPTSIVEPVLNQEIEIKTDGEADSVSARGNTLIYSNPSSVTRFLFTTIYSVLSKHIDRGEHKDKLSLGLLHMCKNYVYADFNTQEFKSPPVIADFNKFHVPSFIIRELVEPIVGRLSDYNVICMNCNFTDTCRTIDDIQHLQKTYGLKNGDLTIHDLPMILSNLSVHNVAASCCHLTIKALDMSAGVEKTPKIIKHLLLDPDGSLIKSVILILKTLKTEPSFVIDFLKYFASHAGLSDEEREIASEHQYRQIAADAYLRPKIGQTRGFQGHGDGKTTPSVWKQWSQWSMLMGLIEKQLTPMRGSMWPTTENLKPHEDHLQMMMDKEKQSKNKNQLNFEELLEIARDLYNHKAVEPGSLTETMMKDHRVWK